MVSLTPAWSVRSGTEMVPAARSRTKRLIVAMSRVMTSRSEPRKACQRSMRRRSSLRPAPFDKRRFHELATARGVTPAQLSPNLPYTPAPGAPFPHGGFYGDQRCLPLPDVERLNNPNIP